MYSVYYKDKMLVFSREAPAAGDFFSYEYTQGDFTPAKMLQNFENSNTLYCIAPDPDEAFEEFAKCFIPIEAAGGIVEDSQGSILMMMRRGWWDLPKGHIEPGETKEEAALREICEETGLKELTIQEPLPSTQHIYMMNGKWEMKRTWWYIVRYSGTEDPVPQTEEDITEIRWLKGRELWEAVNSSYGTIRSLFGRYLAR